MQWQVFYLLSVERKTKWGTFFFSIVGGQLKFWSDDDFDRENEVEEREKAVKTQEQKQIEVGNLQVKYWGIVFELFIFFSLFA